MYNGNDIHYINTYVYGQLHIQLFPLDPVRFPLGRVRFSFDPFRFHLDFVHFPLEPVRFLLDPVWSPLDPFRFLLDPIRCPLVLIRFPLDFAHFLLEPVRFPLPINVIPFMQAKARGDSYQTEQIHDFSAIPDKY